jgi:DNA polymerase-3 subunit epsilon
VTSLPLRLRVFLLFALLAAGCLGALTGGLWLGWRQAAGDGRAFLTAGIAAGFGILAVTAGLWLLFDENVAKPVERLASWLRVGSVTKDCAPIDAAEAPYLGDLAPAAAAIHERLSSVAADPSRTAREQVERLRGQRDRLLRILSDIPVAILLMTRDHQIVLYDGQAADLMAAEAPVRLDGSLFDYLDRAAVEAALAKLDIDGSTDGAARAPITVPGRSGAIYSGHIRRFARGAGYTLVLEPLDPEAERPPTYDFDLLDRSAPANIAETPLRDLCFVVFDSETTGLDPQRDHVVQIGAVRVVNGRIVPGERFETLVDPGRPIPAVSTRVHGIDDAMVAGAPDVRAACRDFHGFAEGAVIVAHNAPFDMAFLHRAAKAGAPRFDHAVLDTVHMSAVVFGGSSAHTLDALCDRLGITIPADRRHTAMGDAEATARVLTALIPVLEEKGIRTLGQMRAEAMKHRRILEVASAG